MNGNTALKLIDPPDKTLSDTDLMIMAGFDQGLKGRTIAKELGIHEVTVSKKKSKIAKYLDSHPKMVKKSHQVREAIMDRLLKPQACLVCEGKGTISQPEKDEPLTCPQCKGAGKIDVSESYIAAGERVSARIQDTVDPIIKKIEQHNTTDIYCHTVPDYGPECIDVTPAKENNELACQGSDGNDYSI